jgi:uncharacterized protein (DUF362 family)|tara:strand:+ start:6620 stop:7609 length:990 start_codon:yes stop_codon:yes gene_type:complete
MTRRQALARGAGVLVSGSVLGYLALAPEHLPFSRRDNTGRRSEPSEQPLTLPDYSVIPDDSTTALSIGRNGDIGTLLRKALDGMGGITKFVQPGDIVLLKPNVAFDRSPNLGATTNPDIVRELIQLLLVDCRAAEVRVADNPIESPADCFAKSGIKRAAEEAGGRVFLPDGNAFRTLNTPGATLIENWSFFYRPFRDVTKVIGVAAVKDHNLCSASMGIKNWYGLLGGKRNTFHQDIHEIIADLSMMIRPTLTILDGTRVLMSNGPTGGDPSLVRKADVVVAGTDQVAMDAWAYKHLLQRGEDYPEYLLKAEQRGSGRMDPEGRIREVV